MPELRRLGRAVHDGRHAQRRQRRPPRRIPLGRQDAGRVRRNARHADAGRGRQPAGDLHFVGRHVRAHEHVHGRGEHERGRAVHAVVAEGRLREGEPRQREGAGVRQLRRRHVAGLCRLRHHLRFGNTGGEPRDGVPGRCDAGHQRQVLLQRCGAVRETVRKGRRVDRVAGGHVHEQLHRAAGGVHHGRRRHGRGGALHVRRAHGHDRRDRGGVPGLGLHEPRPRSRARTARRRSPAPSR